MDAKTIRSPKSTLCVCVLLVIIIVNVCHGKQDFDEERSNGQTQNQNRRLGKVKITARNDRFFLGSRYGKRFYGSDIYDAEPPKDIADLDRYLGQINQRNDRFFLGSRYGKRAEEVPKEFPESDYSIEASKEDLRSTTFPKSEMINKLQCFSTSAKDDK